MLVNPVIIGSGSYLPEVKVPNRAFLNHYFLDVNGKEIPNDNETIIRKFKAITGIEERLYARPDQNNSDLATFAAEKAIENAAIDAETLDQIIVAHNFGDIKHGTNFMDFMPSLASRVKHNLKIKKPACMAFDVIYGCPGWILGMQQAEAAIRSGMAKRVLVIGSETLSRTVDEHDRDSMIYSDGAGAVIVEAQQNDSVTGILASHAASFTEKEVFYLYNGQTYNRAKRDQNMYIKMHGHKIYQFALQNVPLAMQAALEKSGRSIDEVSKILIHQANEKMDEAIVSRFYKLFDKVMPKDIMPMIISKYGNSSVATIPTLFDLIYRKQIDAHRFKKGDVLLFASVGAGMHINSFVYQV